MIGGKIGSVIRLGTPAQSVRFRCIPAGTEQVFEGITVMLISKVPRKKQCWDGSYSRMMGRV